MRSLEDIPMLLLKTSRDNDGKSFSLANYSGMVHSAPACGLCLAKVIYEHDDFL
jgi:hypothetical protein